MNKITLLVTFLSLYSIHTDAMYSQTEDKPAIALSTLIEQKIFTIPSLCFRYRRLKKVAVTFNALAQTNTFLNKCMNDDNNTLIWIKQLSQEFDCADIDIAQKLCTKAANNRFTLQQALLVGWRSPFKLIRNKMNKLQHIGVDLNFTYSKEESTALIQATSYIEYGGYSDVAVWLIKNGADINICNSEGQNASMIALRRYNKSLIDKFLDHPAFNVNHQDSNKNTPLHCCFYGLGYGGRYQEKDEYFFKVIVQLLLKGAKSTIKNKDNMIPLDFARELNYRPIIDLLELFKKTNS